MRNDWKLRRSPTEKKYKAVTLREHWTPLLKELFICSWKGHDDHTKFGGAVICRRCS